MIRHSTAFTFFAAICAYALNAPAQNSTTQPAPPSASPQSQPQPLQLQLPKSDRIIWTLQTTAPSFGSAAAGDIDGDGKPEIVFGTYFNDEHLYAVNAEDGSVLWKFKSQGGPIDTSVLLYDVNKDGKLEIIFGDSAYGTIFCLNGAGEKIWTFKGQSGTDSPAAAADLDGDGKIEIVYGTMKVKGGNGRVNVLNGADGTHKWSAEIPGHIQSEPALCDLNADGTLDVLVNTWNGDNKLHALNGKDGSELWTFDTGDWIYHGVSVFDFDRDSKPEIIVSNRKGSVWMLQGESGAAAWEAKLEGERDGMVFGPTSLVDSDHDGVPEIAVCGLHLHLLDATGKVRWRNPYGGRSIARGMAVGDADGDGVDDLVFGQGTSVRAVRSDSGEEIWAVDLKTGRDSWQHIDNAPLLLDADGDGKLDVFIVHGRGLSNETKQNNFGQAVMLHGGEGKVQADGGWHTFRGGALRCGHRGE